MDKLVCVQDFEEEAFRKLDKNALQYFKAGADDEFTLQENKRAYLRILILPRVLRDVAVKNLSTTIFGSPVSIPIGVSPAAFQKCAHPDGEIGNCKAAASMGTIFTLSYFATCSIEQVAEACPNGRKWLQTYMHKDRSITANLIRRAEAAGFEAIVITVDCQSVGKRRADHRNSFVLPPHLSPGNVTDEEASISGGIAALHKLMDFGTTWEVFKFLKSVTRLPIVAKGILTPADARLALDYGVDAIFVSNHGGRQLDTVITTIDMLPHIVREVNKACPIFVDGGIRRGSDVFKALALGADMVFAGRPLIWGLAVNGEKGAKRVLEILKEELDLTMSLAGKSKLQNKTEKFGNGDTSSIGAWQPTNSGVLLSVLIMIVFQVFLT